MCKVCAGRAPARVGLELQVRRRRLPGDCQVFPVGRRLQHQIQVFLRPHQPPSGFVWGAPGPVTRRSIRKIHFMLITDRRGEGELGWVKGAPGVNPVRQDHTGGLW